MNAGGTAVKRQPVSQLDDHGRVRDDVACWYCRYNLRTQAGDQPCPECGEPIADSLGRTPSGWARIVNRGIVQWTFGTVALVIAMLVTIRLGFVDLGAIVGGAIAPIALLLGTWMITWPQPDQSVRPLSGLPRVLRGLAILLLLLVEFTCAEQLARTVWGWAGNLILTLTLLHAAWCLSALLTLTILWWLTRLVRRVPRKRLTTTLTTLLVLIAVVDVFGIAVLSTVSADWVLGLGLFPAASSITGIARLIITWAPLIAKLGTIVVLVLVYRAIHAHGIRR